MTVDEAKLRLSFHSGRNSDTEDPRWKNGFLGLLRPYRGNPPENCFHDIVACLRTLADEIRDAEFLEKSLVADVTNITHFGRAWAVYEGGMLRRNNLITESDWKTIELWVDCISYAFACLTDGADDETAFADYAELSSNEALRETLNHISRR